MAVRGSWPLDGINYGARERPMTTDPDEGRRQIEAMQPKPIKVGDKVRLSAGGERVMTVLALDDYGNNAVCRWEWPDATQGEGGFQETFPVRALVRVESQTSGG